MKIRGGKGDISIPIVEALPTIEPPKLMAIHGAAAERGGLIKKEKNERTNESSWVKLKAFPTNVGDLIKGIKQQKRTHHRGGYV